MFTASHVTKVFHVTGSILMPGCRIGANCSLTDCIIGGSFVKAGVSCVCRQSRDKDISINRDMSVHCIAQQRVSKAQRGVSEAQNLVVVAQQRVSKVQRI